MPDSSAILLPTSKLICEAFLKSTCVPDSTGSSSLKLLSFGYAL